MAIAVISNWLDTNRNFIEGLAIYKKYGKNKALLQILNCGPNRFTTRKLTEALIELNAVINEEKYFKENISPAALPGDMKILHDNTMNLYKDMATKHNHLANDMSEDNRRIIAEEILNADDLIHANFETLDHYKDTGERKLSPIKKRRRGKEIAEMNTTELMKALSSIPTYISKSKTELKNPDLTAGDILRISDKIKMYEDDFKNVKMKLGI